MRTTPSLFFGKNLWKTIRPAFRLTSRLYPTKKEIICLLSERGMIIDDPKRAEHYLDFHILLPLIRLYVAVSRRTSLFQKACFVWKDFATLFFDRRLRLLSMDALERIEVAFRTVIINCLSEKCGAFWLENPDCFHDKNKRNTQASMLEEIRKQIEQQKTAPSLEHYYQTYSAPENSPVWIVFEILPFGCVSRIYENLKRPYRKAVAGKFGIEESILQSWFHALSVLHNSCAHHSHIWNRKYPFKIKKANAFPELDTTERFYCFALIIDILLNRIVQTPSWTLRLKETINEFSDVVNPVQMGFPADRDKNDRWRIRGK